ncbi:MAG: hypothetical protein K5869_10730 [Saccharofermentans sp.]|nr:hypothetical protein [Saccharofermentans sp.]
MKNHRLWIRLSEEEHKRLSELVEESGTGTMSGYIRACINEKKLPNFNAEELKSVKFQLSKLGNNLNQMVYLARTEGICDTAELDRLLKNIDEQVKRIYKDI